MLYFYYVVISFPIFYKNAEYVNVILHFVLFYIHFKEKYSELMMYEFLLQHLSQIFLIMLKHRNTIFKFIIVNTKCKNKNTHHLKTLIYAKGKNDTYTHPLFLSHFLPVINII